MDQSIRQKAFSRNNLSFLLGQDILTMAIYSRFNKIIEAIKLCTSEKELNSIYKPNQQTNKEN